VSLDEALSHPRQRVRYRLQEQALIPAQQIEGATKELLDAIVFLGLPEVNPGA
jgi:hypothetical protein